MANAAKRKGDAAELEAVRFLVDAAPDLVVNNPWRMLGAGRKDDVGDLRVLPEVAIQVRSYKLDSIGLAVRSAATDALTQAANGGYAHAFGMIPYPRARKGSVRWLASWVRPLDDAVSVAEFKRVSDVLMWVRDDDGPHGYRTWPRGARVAHLTGPGAPVFVAPIEAWLAGYRQVREDENVPEMIAREQ